MKQFKDKNNQPILFCFALLFFPLKIKKKPTELKKTRKTKRKKIKVGTR